MKITVWGARGSLPAPGPDNNEFGGNTSCVQVVQDEAFIVLDAGSGIRRLGYTVPPEVKEIHLLLTHLHLDHIMGMGFFRPLYNPDMKVKIYGPASKMESLKTRLTRCLSPPLFPIRLQDVPCQMELVEIGESEFEIGPLKIRSGFVCHPGPTVGFRIENGTKTFTFIPDHEPALGSTSFPNVPQWTSGYALAQGADLLFHDAQFTMEEYALRVGWGHSTFTDAIAFANMAQVKRLFLFHHDPAHTDVQIRHFLNNAMNGVKVPFEIGIAAEGDSFEL